MDHIALEDFQKFHEGVFDIIEGYYFDGGYNYNLPTSINVLFNKWLEFKKAKNEPAQQLMKLLLNSSYGKTCLKSSDSSIKMVNNNELENYVINHSTNVIRTLPFTK